MRKFWGLPSPSMLVELVLDPGQPAQALGDVGEVDEQADRGGGRHRDDDQERRGEEARPEPVAGRLLLLDGDIGLGRGLAVAGGGRDGHDLGRVRVGLVAFGVGVGRVRLVGLALGLGLRRRRPRAANRAPDR